MNLPEEEPEKFLFLEILFIELFVQQFTQVFDPFSINTHVRITDTRSRSYMNLLIFVIEDEFYIIDKSHETGSKGRVDVPVIVADDFCSRERSYN